jgi:hypothetical protein
MGTRALLPPVHVIQPSDPNAAQYILKFNPSQLAPGTVPQETAAGADTVRGARCRPRRVDFSRP